VQEKNYSKMTSSLKIILLGLAFFEFIFLPVGVCAKNSQHSFYTAVGADKNGTDDGIIPEFKDASIPFESEYYDDQINFIVDKNNYINYLKYLPGGLSQLIQKIKNFEIYVFPTRRTANYPDFLKESFLEKKKSKPVRNNDLFLGKINHLPYRFPETGEEIIWNHLSRYQGGSVERFVDSFVVRKNGQALKTRTWIKRVYNSHINKPKKNILFYALAKYLEPVSLKGDILLVHEPVNQVFEKRNSWIYSSAQRRVRKAPELGHDSIGSGSQGLVTADQIDGFNGSTERYNWRILGKKIMIVPYNINKIKDKELTYTEMLGSGSIKSELLRYELHRVWIVEGILKENSRHIYAKRVFYIDEDSWIILLEECYSVRGDMWRVAVHGIIQFYEHQFPVYGANIYHDLNNGSYFITGLENEIKKKAKIGFISKSMEFQPDELRRLAAGN
tara:strand:- start:8813 stop:10147 length:1335 start_codon:yes stop_codon:yes gene_type:complete